MRVFLKSSLTLFCIVVSFSLLAQTNKMGYVNVDALYEQWPQTIKLKQKLVADRQKFQKEIENKQKLLDQKLEDPKASHEEVIKLKETLKSDYTKSESTLFSLEQSHKQLFETEYKKAIHIVAQEKGYQNVQPFQQGLYYKAEDDLTSEVQKKML